MKSLKIKSIFQWISIGWKVEKMLKNSNFGKNYSKNKNFNIKFRGHTSSYWYIYHTLSF